MNRDHRHNLINGMMEGRCVFLLGGGTSLTGFDFSKLDNEFTIAVNHTIEHYQNAKALLFGDKIFLNKSPFDLRKYNGLIFAAEKCANVPVIKELMGSDRLFIFRERRDEPILNAKMGLYHPTSSGIFAISLALQMRARKIYLLGYDYYSENGKIHFFDDYEHHVRFNTKEKFNMKLKKFVRFERWKAKIYNLNPKSAIKEFQKLPISDIIR